MRKRSFILLVVLVFLGLCFLTACQGAQGEKGDKGIQGATGDTGAKGPDGNQGAQGDKGAKGVDGADAADVELDVTSDGIVWRNEGDENWQPVISFDDLFMYRRTYTITLDYNGGTFTGVEEPQTTGLIYKEAAYLPDEVEKDPYTFIGWFDENDNLVADNVVDEVVRDYKLTAKFQAEILLTGVEEAHGAPRVEYEGRELADMLADLKVKFLTDYCAAAEYDAEKTAAVLALTGSDLYSELKYGISSPKSQNWTSEVTNDDGTTTTKNYLGLFYDIVDGQITTTKLCDDYLWLIEWMCSRKAALYISGAKVAYPGDRTDPRTLFMLSLLKDHESTSASYMAENLLQDQNYSMNILCCLFVNFFEQSGVCYSNTSIDKVTPFGPADVVGVLYETNGESETGCSPIEDSEYDPYEGFTDILDVTLEPVITLNEGESYELIEIAREGYTFLGYYHGEEKVTVVTPELNGEQIEAKWQAN